MPADVPHVIDLLRRAHAAAAACLVAPDVEAITACEEPPPPVSLTQRLEAIARLAMADGREHVVREGQAIIAVGDGELGAGVLLPAGRGAPDEVAAVSDDLRKLLGEMSVGRRRELGVRVDPRQVPEWVVTGAASLDGMAFALCEAVRRETGRAAAVVVRDSSPQQGATVVAVSPGADRRLIGRAIGPDSVAGRALSGDVPVVGHGGSELFGRSQHDRRRHAEPAIAFPLRSGREGVGALVVFGSHRTLDPEVRERLMWLTVDAGPRLAAALQVRHAETQALTDPLTGLPNRRALDRALASFDGPGGALLCVDVDHFKAVNDGFGHQAGDQVLRHLARIFCRTLREGDLATRIGGEEFALWLPGATLGDAQEIAERIRAGVAETPCHAAGADLKITCSLGLAAVPETVSRVDNLLPAADAALYRAKHRGRNRVETAQPGGY